MFCAKCGTQLEPGAVCANCGDMATSETQEIEKTEKTEDNLKTDPAPETDLVSTPATVSENPATPLLKGKLKILLPVTLVAILGIFAIAFATGLIGSDTQNGATTDAQGDFQNLRNAFTTTLSEASERISSSPLGALEMLPGILNDGVIGFAAGFPGFNVRGELHSVLETSDFAASINVAAFLMPVSFNAVLNPYRMAANISLIGPSYYGFYFDTFSQDFAQFGELLGQTPAEIEEISNAVEMLANSLRVDTIDFEAIFQPFVDILFNSEYTIDNNVTSFSIMENEIIEALELLQQLSVSYVDTPLQALAEAGILPSTPFSFFSVAESIQIAMDIFRQEDVYLDFTLDFYTENDRLNQIALFGNITGLGIGDATTTIMVTADFGENLYEPWFLEAVVINEHGQAQTTANWSYEIVDNTHVNRFNFGYVDPWVTGETIYLFTYNASNGNFTIESAEQNIISGVFTRPNNGFNLSFADSILVSVHGHPGAQIPDITFIPPDEWEAHPQLLDLVDIFGMLMWQFGF
ncbi:MAG: hypothetical protein FWG63_10670 [Defluviitaleaceae bacterium]|nr:hypothetical protein [Defluviitaleaceae bacterium]